MKRVLQISNYLYPHIGGIEQVARDIANALPKEEYEQKIICFNEDAEDKECVCHRRETVQDSIDGVEVIRCGCITKIDSQSISLTFGRELKALMDDFSPDIVIFHYPNPFQAMYLMKYRKRKFKLFLYWHLDITKQKLLRVLFHNQTKSLIKRSQYVLGATPMHVNESAYSPYFGDRRRVLPYAIDEDRLVISEDEEKTAENIREKYYGKVLCFFIGRHVPYKGLTYLIEASKQVPDKFYFIIAGKGELTEELKKQASGDKKIEFVGRISDSEWRAYLKACDIFCFPSVTRNEGFGLALAEGMYYGKPAITFRIPGSGVNYVNIDGVTGIECQNADSKAYANALITLGSDDGMREKYGRQAREWVLKNFTKESFARNIQAVLKEPE